MTRQDQISQTHSHVKLTDLFNTSFCLLSLWLLSLYSTQVSKPTFHWPSPFTLLLHQSRRAVFVYKEVTLIALPQDTCHIQPACGDEYNPHVKESKRKSESAKRILFLLMHWNLCLVERFTFQWKPLYFAKRTANSTHHSEEENMCTAFLHLP